MKNKNTQINCLKLHSYIYESDPILYTIKDICLQVILNAARYFSNKLLKIHVAYSTDLPITLPINPKNNQPYKKENRGYRFLIEQDTPFGSMMQSTLNKFVFNSLLTAQKFGDFLAGRKSLPSFTSLFVPFNPEGVTLTLNKNVKNEDLSQYIITAGNAFTEDWMERAFQYEIKQEQSRPKYESRLLKYANKNNIGLEYLKNLPRESKKLMFCTAMTHKEHNYRNNIKELLENQYSLCKSSIKRIQNKNDGEWKYFFNLTYKMPKKQVSLDPEKQVGIDMGVNNVVVAATNFDENRAYMGRGDVVGASLRKIKAKNTREAAKRKFFKRSNRRFMSSQESDWSENFSHIIANDVISFCLRVGAGTIVMEDLSGIPSDTYRRLCWFPYKIQEKIIYKASRVGIQTFKTNPAYTSRTCSKCGYEDKKNRVSGKDFKCQKCDYSCNADFNAAVNISKTNVKELKKTEDDGIIENVSVVKGSKSLKIDNKQAALEVKAREGAVDMQH